MNTDFIEKTNKIYEHLLDEESKRLYVNRLKYNLTGDVQYLNDIVCSGSYLRNVLPWLNDNKNLPVYIYGAGIWGDKLYHAIKDLASVEGFVDSYKAGEYYCGKKIYSIDELTNSVNNVLFIVSIKKGYAEVKNLLLKRGVDASKIIALGEIYDNEVNEYFETFIWHDDNEVFVDAGVYDGGTTLDFVKWSHNKYKKIYMFEPSIDYYNRFYKNVEHLDNCEWIKKGLWSKPDTLRFFDRPDSDIATEQNLSGLKGIDYSDEKWVDIPVTSLDSYLPDERVTFIKMDIEGSELEAIKGAKRIITEQKPKLAICLYHKLEDIWTIPELLLEYNPEYYFYVRHYSMDMLDTVLYAVNNQMA
ncbi:methyltransferase, FkbM family [Pseudobutyrivibrio sp. ACV-2]|uniref:FkbM family methyltransferase n=1 Tax=Pseudobutyrivibrio sp. ACV-2 TaxID=1520801 RepID=UPI00089D9CD6|nr:FkbM family methyltransferase [Pseudobutyrivibrio sp. ACV-2]SEA10636.1 methyltransferase, FkbM family [Pseudobutyrivibrio sp. ACV-2]